MNKKRRINNKRIRLLLTSIIIIIGIVAASLVVNGMIRGESSENNKKADVNIDNQNTQNTINNQNTPYTQNTPNTQNNKLPQDTKTNDNGITKDNQNALNNQKNPDSQISSTSNKDVTINIKATGDIMFHPSQIDGAYDSASNTYNFDNSFRAVKSIISQADIAIANFEGTTAGNTKYKYQGYPIFNAPDEVLDAMKNAGFDILSTANNHCLDTRMLGVERTVEQIQKRGMDSIGTFKEKPINRVLIKDVKGIRLAFLSYTEMVNGLEQYVTKEDLEQVNIIDIQKIKEDIKYANSKNADVIIIFLHWGDEYAKIQAKRQEELADKLFNEGVDIILGSHPHVIQSAKLFEMDGKTKYVAYSMGNFLSNQRVETLSPYGISEAISKYTEDGVIVDIDIEKKAITNEIKIKNISYTPLWVYKGTTMDGKVEHVVYPILNYIENDELNDNSKTRMNRSYNNTLAQIKGQ